MQAAPSLIRRASLKRTIRPRMVFLIAVNVITILAFLNWRDRYVSKESIIKLMDDRVKAIFSPEREVSTAPETTSNFTGKAAYVSMVCLESDFLPVRALVHSIKLTEPANDIVVVVMHPIEDLQRNNLTTLGAKLVDTTTVKFDIDMSYLTDDEKEIESESEMAESEKSVNHESPSSEYERRQCRANVIQAWRLLEYDRILYMNPEMLVLENIDEVFQEPPFTATLELGGVIDESIMLLEPSMSVYKELKSVMVKAQHLPNEISYLNYFFKDIHPLNPLFNVKASYAEREYSRYFFQNAKVYNFEGTFKPWSFWFQGPKQWRRYFNERMTFAWRQMDYRVREKLGMDDPATIEWRNERGSEEICKSYLTSRVSLPERIMDRYSVLLATHSLRRQETLPLVIEQFLASPKVDKIFIIWHNKDQPISKNIQELLDSKKDQVVLLKQAFDSLNNRFNPVAEVRTGAVLISDDDVWAPIEDIELAFEAWRRQPDSLVGFAPRVDCLDPTDEMMKYCWPNKLNPHRYSIMLTKLMFMDANFLFLWRCSLPDLILKYVDDLINCEDIAVNFLISGVSSQPPLHIISPEVYDFGLEHGISSSPKHFAIRTECVQQITELFGRDTLVSARGSMSKYQNTDFLSSTWVDFLEVLREKEGHVAEFRDTEVIPADAFVSDEW
ncbi:glycosyl transferase family 64 domain-containing protein [Lipomyces oligophaga]|uniref:glycosyl transferase family 64 domain-containing protein n=1 Tax=Lipomyces oligophaga TaxID=45792 RepID=UPI0034CE06DE